MDGAASFEELAPDAAAMAERVRAAHCWLVVEGADAAVLGYAHATPFRERAAYRWSAECGVYLRGDARGRGVGRLLYAALLERLAARGFAQAFASISLPNPASVALHGALGFQRAGLLRAAGWKGGRWVDVEVWQRALAEPGNPPGEPRSDRGGPASGFGTRSPHSPDHHA